MTEKEIELLEIAKNAIYLNSHINAALTGSLMLSLRGIEKRREASDIDILVIGNCLIKKEDQNASLKHSYENKYELD